MKTLNSYLVESKGYKVFEKTEDIDNMIARWLIDSDAVYQKSIDRVLGYINPDHTINIQKLRGDGSGQCDVRIDKRLLDGNRIPDYIVFDGPVDMLSIESNDMISVDLSDVYKHIPGICRGISLFNCKISSFNGLPDQTEGGFNPGNFAIYLDNVEGVRSLKGLDKYECDYLLISNCPGIVSLKGGPQIVPAYGSCQINIQRNNPNIDLNDGGLVEIAGNRVNDLYLSMKQISDVRDPRRVFGNAKYDKIHIICGKSYQSIGECIPWDKTTRVEMVTPNVYMTYTHLNDIFGDALTNVVPKPSGRPTRVTALGPSKTRVSIESIE